LSACPDAEGLHSRSPSSRSSPWPCRDATQVTVRITTRAKCSDLSGVELVVGPDQTTTQDRFEKRFTTAVTRSCDGDGVVGSLVVAPGGESATIVVAAGVQVGAIPAPDPGACGEPANAKSCIIARRSFSFLEHTSLDLPIELDPLCIGKACDPASTCFKGTCVSASVTCNGTACGLVEEHPGEGDGGGNEGGSSDGAYDADLDGMSFEDVSLDGGSDGAKITDAWAEADTGGIDGSAPLCGNAGAVYCYPNGVTGTLTVGSCGNSADMTTSCCRCTCAVTATIVSCDVSASSGSSCHPLQCP